MASQVNSSGEIPDRRQVEEILVQCERALVVPGPVDLRAHGFQRAVRAVERNPEWVPETADRIAAIDRQAYERRVRRRVPVGVGLTMLILGTLAGAGLIVWSAVVPRSWRGPVLLGGMAVLLVATHDLAHLLVGRALGIRFVGMYLRRQFPFQPGLKIDQGSYLRVSPRTRALTHASGAVVTKLIPFALLGIAREKRYPTWLAVILVAVGLAQIATDVLWSTKYSDWKRVRAQLAMTYVR